MDWVQDGLKISVLQSACHNSEFAADLLRITQHSPDFWRLEGFGMAQQCSQQSTASSRIFGIDAVFVLLAHAVSCRATCLQFKYIISFH